MENSIVLNENWSNGRKLNFRFVFILFSLFILPFPFSIPFNVFQSYILDSAVGNFWNWMSETLASIFFGMEELPDGSPGSGDRTGDWIRYSFFVFLALFGTMIWTILDRGRKNYHRLWRWFTLGVVYYLIYFMFLYGFIKVFWLQMPDLRIDRMLKTYGHSSPMGLLWTFMGASKTYSMYAGLSEVIGGFLLIFRRTRTLGGLVTFGVMFNVLILNMAYDVPVKLFSAQLMFMGLYIALIDRRALLGLFWFNKSREVRPWPPLFKSRLKNIILFVIQALLIFYFAYSQISSDLDRRKQYGELRPKSPLYGLYDVEHYVSNGDTIPPLITDDIRWQRLILEDPTRSIVMYMDDRVRYYSSETDTVESLLTIHIGRDSLRKSYPLNYLVLEDGLQIDGVFQDDTLSMKLKTYDMSNFYLKDRGFNWVNEVPWHRYNPNPKPNWK